MQKIVTFLLLGLLAGCEEQMCFRKSEVQCTKVVQVKNPNCLAFLPKQEPMYAGVMVPIISSAAGTIAAANAAANAAAQRRRREEDCKARPLVDVCKEYHVILK